jgi:hypothetical protein
LFTWLVLSTETVSVVEIVKLARVVVASNLKVAKILYRTRP